MKAKLFVTLILSIMFATPAMAEEQGAWIRVNAQGVAMGSQIVCTYSVCGDPNSLFNKMTLAPGERYILQFKADPVTGNVAGIGTSPDYDLRYDFETNQWKQSQIITRTLPDKTIYQEKIDTTWQKGAQTSEPQSSITPINYKPTTAAQPSVSVLDYLRGMSFEDLFKLFAQLLKEVSLR